MVTERSRAIPPFMQWIRRSARIPLASMKQSGLVVKRSAGLSLLVPLLLAACGGSDSSAPDRVAEDCGRIVDAICAKWVECKVLLNGTVATAAFCAEERPQLVAKCRQDEGAGLTAASDADVDACVRGFQTFQCSNLCNQVPQDPAACQKISAAPNTEVMNCAP